MQRDERAARWSSRPQEVGLKGTGVSAPPCRQPQKPRLKPVDRTQLLLRTVDVDELVGPDHSVRAIWALVEQLDLRGFYEAIQAVEGKPGRSALDPQLLISMWVYAYSQGVSSAREVSRLCEYDPAFQWLTGLQTVSYHTLSDFRVGHQEVLDELFTQVLGVLSAGGLITLERVMHDGTKIKACASGDSFRREDRLRNHLAMAREQIEQLGDPRSEEVSQRVAKARERALREKQQKLEQALEQLEEIRAVKQGKEKFEARASWSDPEARVMKHADGGYAPSYNLQLSTDATAKVVIGVSVSQSASDCGQLGAAVKVLEANLGRRPAQMVVDGGYIDYDTIVGMHEQTVDLIGSLSQEAIGRNGQMKQRGVSPEFFRDAFKYDPVKDGYCCPAGRWLSYLREEARDGEVMYRYRARAEDCQACSFKAQCCPQNDCCGRSVVRREGDAIVAAFKARMQTPEAQAIYKERAPVAEFPNLWIKAKMKLRQFRLRGLIKVKIESVWAALSYNIAQWIRLCWKPRGVAILKG